jgi:REP element-mobilizing transposase RayT
MRARPVLPKRTLLVTRRARHRTFLLRPSDKTNEILGYIFGYTSAEYDVRISAIEVLSNHWHGVLYDPHGNIVRFLQNTHSLIARAVNAAHGDFENLWSTSQTSLVECAEADDVTDKIGYTMANAVTAGLVRHGHHWPGLKRVWPQPPKSYKRPHFFFSDDMPDEVTLVMHRPEGYEGTDEQVAAELREAVDRAENEARDEADREGRRFLGRRAVLRQSRHASATTRERRFGISPRVAAKNKWRRVELLQRNRAWDIDYDAALVEWRSGNREAVFPYGTYKMRVLHRARCVGPPT